MLRNLITPLILLAALAGCRGIDYEAQGDDLHRRGDYYGAVDSYKQVPAGDGSPELGSKLQQAQSDLIEDAVSRAQRALDDGRFEEALTIARRAIDYERDGRLLDIESAAKRRTVSNAVEVGRLHLQRGEFDEAIAQFEIALRYDSSPATKSLLLDAKAGAGRKLIAEARRLAAAEQFDAALDAARRALEMHDAPEHRKVQVDIEAAKARWMQRKFDDAHAAAVAKAGQKLYREAADYYREALRFGQSEDVKRRILSCDAMADGLAAVAAKDLAAAIRHFEQVVEYGHDAETAREELAKIDAERQAHLDLAATQRANRDYAGATASLRAALAIRPDETLDAWVRYCNHMQAGATAVNRKDYDGAFTAFEMALAERLDDGGTAARLRDGVRTSTWTVTLKSLTVKPFKANDEVWDGSLRRALPLGRILAGFQGRGGPAAAKKAADIAAALLPPQNLPDCFVRITLPNGAVYRTDVNKEALHANVGAAFTITGHAFSEAPVVIAVRDHDGESEEGVGIWRTTLGKLIGGGATQSAQFEQVFDLTFTVELKSATPVAAWTSGCTVEQEGTPETPATPETPEHGTDPVPATSTRWLVTVNAIRVSPSDVPQEAGDGAPEAELFLMLGDAEILNAFAGENKPSRQWLGDGAPSANVNLAEGGKLRLRLVDRDDTDSDVVIEYDLDNAALAEGSIRLETANGSYVELTAVKQQ